MSKLVLSFPDSEAHPEYLLLGLGNEPITIDITFVSDDEELMSRARDLVNEREAVCEEDHRFFWSDGLMLTACLGQGDETPVPVARLAGLSWRYKVERTQLKENSFHRPRSLVFRLLRATRSGDPNVGDEETCWAQRKLDFVGMGQRALCWLSIGLFILACVLANLLAIHLEHSPFVSLITSIAAVLLSILAILGVGAADLRKKAFRKLYLYRWSIGLAVAISALLVVARCSIAFITNLTPVRTNQTMYIASIEPGQSTLGWTGFGIGYSEIKDDYIDVVGRDWLEKCPDSQAYNDQKITAPFYFYLFSRSYVVCQSSRLHSDRKCDRQTTEDVKPQQIPGVFREAWKRSGRCDVLKPLEITDKEVGSIFDFDIGAGARGDAGDAGIRREVPGDESANVDLVWKKSYGDDKLDLFSESGKRSFLTLIFRNDNDAGVGPATGYGIQMRGDGPVVEVAVEDIEYDKPILTPIWSREAEGDLSQRSLTARVYVGTNEIGSLTVHGTLAKDDGPMECRFVQSGGYVEQLQLRLEENGQTIAMARFRATASNLTQKIPLCLPAQNENESKRIRTLELVLAKGFAPDMSWSLRLVDDLIPNRLRIYGHDGEYVGSLDNIPKNERGSPGGNVYIGPLFSHAPLPALAVLWVEREGAVRKESPADGDLKWLASASAPFTTNWFWWIFEPRRDDSPERYRVSGLATKMLYCKASAGEQSSGSEDHRESRWRRSCRLENNCGSCRMTLAGRAIGPKQNSRPVDLKGIFGKNEGEDEKKLMEKIEKAKQVFKKKYRPCCRDVELYEIIEESGDKQ